MQLIQLKAELNTITEHNKVIKEENKDTTEKLASYKNTVEQLEAEIGSHVMRYQNEKTLVCFLCFFFLLLPVFTF